MSCLPGLLRWSITPLALQGGTVSGSARAMALLGALSEGFLQQPHSLKQEEMVLPVGTMGECSLVISKSLRGSFFPSLEEDDRHVYSQVALWSDPAEPKKSDGLPSSHPTSSLPFNSNWQCLCWYNSISISGFCWDGWLSPWVIPMISLSHGCSSTPLPFSSEQALSFFEICES